MIRVYADDDFMSHSVKIAIVRHPNDPDVPYQSGLPDRQILHLEPTERGTAYRWDELDEAGSGAPTLTLDDDTARALLDALTRHYHGAEDTRALRRDYDDERRRVDRLTASLSVIAQSLATFPAETVEP